MNMCCHFSKKKSISLSLVHVGVGEPAHEGVWADHLPLANASAGLGVATGKLVDIDGDNVGSVVKLDGALEPGTMKSRISLELLMFIL